jgi:hypothetical protein
MIIDLALAVVLADVERQPTDLVADRYLPST